jgi:hypothetical protein
MVNEDTIVDEDTIVEEDAPETVIPAQKRETAEVRDHRKQQTILGVATLFLVVLAAILIGVLVGKDDTTESRSNSITEGSTSPASDLDSFDPTDNPGDGSNATEIPNDPNNNTNDTEMTGVYKSFGPFEVEIPLYSPDVLTVYADEEEAQAGFRQFAFFFLDNVVNRNLGVPGFQNVGFGNNNFMQDGVQDMNRGPEAPQAGAPVDGDASFAEETAGSAGRFPDEVGDEVDDFGTNNQEENVDQADVAKSDGRFIYAAYGDHLLVMRVETEELVLKLKMPEIDCEDSIIPPPIFEPPILEEEFPPMEDPEADPNFGFGLGDFGEGEDAEDFPTENAERSSLPYYDFCQTPSIQALFLSDTRLAIVVSGYGSQFRAMADPVVLPDFLSTHLRLYSTEKLDDDTLEDEERLKLLGVQDINGHYQKGFLIDNIAYIATMSSLNTWYWLVNPNERWNPAYQYLADDEYVEAITTNAEEQVEGFVNELIAELSITTGELPTVANLNLLTDNPSGVDGFENIVFGEGYANSMVQITSFDMEEALVTSETEGQEEPELQFEITCKFLPTSWGQVYSAEDMLIVAGQGSHFDPVLRASEETTYLFGFKYDGVSTVPAVNGQVPGYLLNAYSLDYINGYLRVATTIQNRMFIDMVFARPVDIPVFVDSVVSSPRQNGAAEDNTDSGGGESGSTVSNPDLTPALPTEEVIPPVTEFIFLSECPLITEEDECYDEKMPENCANLLERGCETLFYSSSRCPYEIDCLDFYEESKCPLPSTGGPCLNGKNFALCLELEREEGCDIVILESCPYQFQCEAKEETEPPTEPVSRTLNQIFVLKATNGADLEIVGNVTLGKPDEGTFARFMEVIMPMLTFLLALSFPI